MSGFASTTLLSGSGTVVVAVPGILARIREQMMPLCSTFENLGVELVGLDYGGTVLDAEQCIADIHGSVQHYLDQGRPVTLLGLSLGGMLSAHAATKFATRDGLNVILGDSPYSYRDLIMAPLPASMNGMARNVFNHWHPRERTNQGYGKFLLEKLFQVPPKPDAIEVPSLDFMRAWHGEVFTDDQWRSHVVRWAKQGLSGHDFTMWQSQIQWMLNQDETPLSGLSTTTDVYLKCTRKNATVRQPQAAEKYRPVVSQVIDVPTAHCGILEGCVTWSSLLGTLLLR